ncbi:uncharacterized protein LOC128395757 [Panonychus citri]|uniref:uncharacterized protein LOC128395757 n=1 Tax=Panonychus citri TaxID=50023 RepID=UPI00230785A8|nr:uncharacterized protein LOC128395757 [Panonychus citri]XP_053212215.1 uncharacterized protein LOC128395757 [Panonychus citri]XP_053212216.1 uncharacterized protein LOC128395757 [Panonychus citri]
MIITAYYTSMLHSIGPHALYKNNNYRNLINNLQGIVNNRLKLALGLNKYTSSWIPIIAYRIKNPVVVWLQSLLESINRTAKDRKSWPICNEFPDRITFNNPDAMSVENFWNRKCDHSPLVNVYCNIGKNKFSLDDELTVYEVESSEIKTFLLALFILINKHQESRVNYTLPENILRYRSSKTTYIIIKMLERHKVLYTWNARRLNRTTPENPVRTIKINNMINDEKDVKEKTIKKIEQMVLTNRRPSIYTHLFPTFMEKFYNSLHGYNLSKIIKIISSINNLSNQINVRKKKVRNYTHYLNECSSTRSHWREDWNLTNKFEIKDKLCKLEKINDILIVKTERLAR